jgi:hypothetical protein
MQEQNELPANEAHKEPPINDDPDRFVDDWMTASAFKSRHGVVYKCACGGILRVGETSTVCARACGAKTRKEDAQLFLAVNVCGRELFAYNRLHAEYLRRVVFAKLRVPTVCSGCPICCMSIMRKLPKEFLKANKRSKVISAIDSMLEALTVEEAKK